VDSRLKHVDHCLDYVRQGLQCSQDVALEPAIVDANGGVLGSDFGKTLHQCRNWRQFWKLAEEHYSYLQNQLPPWHFKGFQKMKS